MKQIPLTQGKFALVDDKNFDYLNQWKWYAKYNKSGKTYYAVRAKYLGLGKNIRQIYMHNIIMSPPKCMFIDHANHDGLDNRELNLRISSRSQNNTNRKTWGKSKYNGVSWDNETNKWIAQIQKDGKSKKIGRFKDELDAAKAYDLIARELHGNFATLNFPYLK